jgi:serine/threonine protein kinase
MRSEQNTHPLSFCSDSDKYQLLQCTGIEHLHYVSNPKIIHGDIKSSNILLGPQNITKVSDFGLSRLLAEGGKARPQTSVKGTAGYLDPE